MACHPPVHRPPTGKMGGKIVAERFAPFWLEFQKRQTFPDLCVTYEYSLYSFLFLLHTISDICIYSFTLYM